MLPKTSIISQLNLYMMAERAKNYIKVIIQLKQNETRLTVEMKSLCSLFISLFQLKFKFDVFY